MLNLSFIGTFIPNLLDVILSKVFGINVKNYCYLLSFFVCGPTTLFQLGLNSIVPEELASEDYRLNAPFRNTYGYIAILLLFSVLYFIRLLYKDSKPLEVKEKKVYNKSQELEEVDMGKNKIY